MAQLKSMPGGEMQDLPPLPSRKNAARAFTALAMASIYLCQEHLQGQVRR
ncbi:hypothetical protein [Acidovorax sp. 56]|nr:hypothetical protein [Acidovorax sp. 56]